MSATANSTSLSPTQFVPSIPLDANNDSNNAAMCASIHKICLCVPRFCDYFCDHRCWGGQRMFPAAITGFNSTACIFSIVGCVTCNPSCFVPQGTILFVSMEMCGVNYVVMRCNPDHPDYQPPLTPTMER